MDDFWNVMIGHFSPLGSRYVQTMKQFVCLYTHSSIHCTNKRIHVVFVELYCSPQGQRRDRTNRGAKQQVNYLSADANREKRLRHNGPRPLLQKCPVVLHSWVIKHIVLWQSVTNVCPVLLRDVFCSTEMSWNKVIWGWLSVQVLKIMFK